MSSKPADCSLNSRAATALLPQIAARSRRESNNPRRQLHFRRGLVTHAHPDGRLDSLGVNTSKPFLAKSKDGRCNFKLIHLRWLSRPTGTAAPRSATSRDGSRLVSRDTRITRDGMLDDHVTIAARESPDDCSGRRSSRGARANPASVPDYGPAGASPPPGRALPHPGGGASRVLGGEREAASGRDRSARGIRTDPRRWPRSSASAPLATRTEASCCRRGPFDDVVRPLNGGARRAARPVLLTQFLPNQTSEVAGDG